MIDMRTHSGTAALLLNMKHSILVIRVHHQSPLHFWYSFGQQCPSRSSIPLTNLTARQPPLSQVGLNLPSQLSFPAV